MQRPQQHARNGSLNMRIRQFPTSVNDNYMDNTWNMLKQALLEILHKNNSGLSFEELYRNAYTMVLHKKGQRLYDGLQEVIGNHFKETIKEQVESSIRGSFLDTLNRMYSEHTTAMVMIRDILMYMDRVYVSQAKVEPVYDSGLRKFREEIIDYPPINEHLKATLLNMIALERAKEAIEWIDLRNACQMLLQLGGTIKEESKEPQTRRDYYEDQFESYFLAETLEYYSKASQKFLEQNSASVYVKKVKECLKEESERADRYLDKITEAKVLTGIKTELITNHMRTVVEMQNSGMVVMLQDRRIEDLRELYELLSLIGTEGIDVMTHCMSQYLRECGKALVESSGETSPVAYIHNLLELYDQFEIFLAQSFHNDKTFKKTIQSDFTYFLNLNPRSPEFLSLFIDDKLKKGRKAQNEGDDEKVLDKAMVLFKFLEDKDVFERYYKSNLAKRLLLGKSSSDDAEKSMIVKLKSECGCQFTAKLEGMFTDMAVSETTLAEYRNHAGPDGTSFDLSVNVLTQVYWPTTPARECKIPPVVKTAFENFESFYVAKHHNRTIALSPGLGQADVRAIFYGAQAMDQSSQLETEQPGTSSGQPPRRREDVKILTVTTYQMILLLHFNSQQQITFEQMLELTGIPERELKKSLQSLAMGKATQRILCRRGAGKEIENADTFFVNDAFTSKLTRIKVQLVSSRGETEPERKETLKKVEDDRKHEIEAAIVRVMKARKILIHNDLITEVTTQLSSRFMPDPTVIKKRIESLIEREYVRRDADSHKKYHYIA